MSFYDKILEIMKCSKFFKQERGAIFVLTALLLPLMFGCLGLAYDVGNLYMHKARLQNVTDAAALAAGRAYLESQKKTTGIIDDVDENTSGKAEKEYVVGGSQTLSGNHQDADKAADDYIYNNIINLGETVYSDQYSHYALRGIKKNAAAEGQEATYTEASEIFYRVGLFEKVPLYFLSVITKKNVETVRAGSVVVLQPGTVIPGSGGGSSTITHTSIFDNLFTFSESLFTKNNIDSDGTIHQSFFGDMVYTHQNGLLDGDLNNSIYYESSTPGPAGDDDATNTNQNHWYEQMGNSSAVPINDPIIDTTFDTKAYLEAFRKKLLSYHLDVITDQAKVELRASDINNENSYLYSQPQKDKDGNDLYSFSYGEKSITYAIDTSQDINSSYRYYSYDANNNKVYYFLNNFGSRVPGYMGSGSFNDDKYQWYEGNYVLDENGNIIYFQIQNDDVYFAKDESGIKRQVAKFNRNSTNCYYKDANSNENIAINYIAIDKNSFGKSSDKLVSHQASNVIHVPLNYKINNDVHSHSTCIINLDAQLEGDENTPIYIILDGIGDVEIQGNASTTRRPVIIVFLSENTKRIVYEFKGGEFKGVIYAPISDFEHVNNLTGAFRGNIITKDIYIQASGGMTWTQENFLENTNYTDDDIKAVSDANKQKIEEANAALTAEIRQKLLDRLGVTAEQMDSKDWFEHLRYPDKQSLYNKWKSLYEEYKNDPAVRNILWPWNEHFNINPGEDQTVNEKLRLINYRTEYQTKDDGSVEDGKVLDPFIFETLAKPDSY